jgi:DNA-binding transcriptional ArsR family regulator
VEVITMSDVGLHARREFAADAVVTVDAGDHPPAECWRTIARSERFQRSLIEAVRDLLAGVPHYRRVRTFLDAGVTAAEGGYARFVAGLDCPPEAEVHQSALDMTAQFGSGEVTPVGLAPDLDTLTDGPLAVLDAADHVPTIAVRIGESFRDRRREQRERTCQLLAALAQVCDVIVVAGRVTTRWLAREHRDSLPSSFSEQYSTPHEEPDTDAVVDAALDELERDSRATKLLRDLAEEPSETLPYSALVTGFEVSQSRVSQVLGTLVDLDLVDKHGPRGNQRVDLLPAGREYLDALDKDETAGLKLTDGEFSGAGQSSNSAVLPAPRKRGSPDAPSVAGSGSRDVAPYNTRYLGRADHAGTVASATDGGITTVRGPFQTGSTDDDRTRFVSYDADRDEAVVAVRATTPLQYMTSVALALASPRLFDEALPPERLDQIDDPPRILRQARCIGGLSAEAVDDGKRLRENIVEWGEKLAEMTTRLHNEDYEDRDRFRGDIMRSAHGLAGTIVHLLDVVGVDVVRELRVPGRLADEQLVELARTVSVATAIQSKYGAFAAYRQLYENREDKRRQALAPEVDMADPTGRYIGGLVLRGPRAHRLGQHVEGTLSNPQPLHEDAPEFSVSVTVTRTDRSDYAEATTRMLRSKNLKTTREAVTLLHTFAGTPYAVTEAIQWLGTDDRPRRVRLDEVRYALSKLSADRLLPDTPPSVSTAVSTLLSRSEALTQTELAAAADVSTRSLRRHMDTLVALDLVRETPDGYRLTLTRRNESSGPTPDALGETDRFQNLVFEATLSVVPVAEAGRVGDPSDPLGRPFCGPIVDPPDLAGLFTASSAVKPWVRVARRLSGDWSDRSSTVEFGATVEQRSLGAVVDRTPV